MQISVFRVTYHRILERDGAEVARMSPTTHDVAADSLATAIAALPQPTVYGERNAVLSVQTLHHDVPLALSMGEDVPKKEVRVGVPIAKAWEAAG